jgi:hypothetical protein
LLLISTTDATEEESGKQAHSEHHWAALASATFLLTG